MLVLGPGDAEGRKGLNGAEGARTQPSPIHSWNP